MVAIRVQNDFDYVLGDDIAHLQGDDLADAISNEIVTSLSESTDDLLDRARITRYVSEDDAWLAVFDENHAIGH